MGYISTASATGWLLKNGDVFAFSGRVYQITALARVGDWSDYKWDFTTSCWLALLSHLFCPGEYQPENLHKTIRNWNILIQQWNAKQNNISLP